MVRQTVNDLISAIHNQPSELEKSAARIRLLRYYHLLPAEDQREMDELIQPFLCNTQNGKTQSDPLFEQAEAILSRLEQRQLVSQ
jgi:hypothetical protein